MNKKRLTISLLILLILIICTGIVSAQDNRTQSIELDEINEDMKIDGNEEISLSSNESEQTIDDKKDPDFDIEFESTFIQHCWESSEGGPSLIINPKFENMTGTFSVSIDDKHYTTQDVTYFSNPICEIWGMDYSLGEHTIKVHYSGDNNYKELTKTHIFSVKLIDIKMGSEEYVIGNNWISIDMVPKASGTATLYINGEKKKTINIKPLDDEMADFGFSNFVYIKFDEFVKFGETYNVTVKFDGKNNGKTLKASKSGKISSVTYPMEICLFEDYEYGVDNRITITTPKDLIKEKINVFIDNEKVEVYQKNNKEYNPYKYNYKPDTYDDNPYTYYVKIKDYKVGTHSIRVNYAGDSKYP